MPGGGFGGFDMDNHGALGGLRRVLEIAVRAALVAAAGREHFGKEQGVSGKAHAFGIQKIERIEAVGGQRPRRGCMHAKDIDAAEIIAALSPVPRGDGGVFPAGIDEENVRVGEKVGQDRAGALAGP